MDQEVPSEDDIKSLAFELNMLPKRIEHVHNILYAN